MAKEEKMALLSEEPTRIRRMFETLLFLVKCQSPVTVQLERGPTKVGCGKCYECQAFMILSGQAKYKPGTY